MNELTLERSVRETPPDSSVSELLCVLERCPIKIINNIMEIQQAAAVTRIKKTLNLNESSLSFNHQLHELVDQ